MMPLRIPLRPEPSPVVDTATTEESSPGIWMPLGVLGALFVAVGGVDALLVWYPLAFGSAEWEFGSVTAALNGLPLVVLGLVFVLYATLRSGRAGMARAIAGLLLAMALVIVIAGVIYATNVPLALRAVQQDPGALQGLKKSMVKTFVQLVCYPAGLSAIAVQARRLTRRSQ